MKYSLHVANMMAIYAILSLSLNLLVGYTGLLSLCHAAFFGVGAYISTLLVTNTTLPFFLCVAIGVAGTIILSCLISFPSLRLRGDYFVLASLGFQTIVFFVLYNWVEVTSGPFGIAGIRSPHIFSWILDTPHEYLLLSLSAAVLSGLLLYFLGASPFGRVLKAIREDELAAASLGKNIRLFKVTAFAIAAGFAAFAGAVFAGYLRYIDPTMFGLTESVFILSIIIVGGAGNTLGPVVGTFLLVLFPEVLRFLGVPESIGPNLRLVIYSLAVIIIMRFRPQGLAGEYKYQ
ncbi:MAG TPA: branched-chain amino acid ABC transporter permease [Pyrinomonadaceae bacterium]|nr:branched-chain amino acid ABC transporter permease [Pyrinomonadaceae bacterium]